MPSHNNIVAQSGFKKKWELMSKVVFDQPMKAKKRREVRQAKALRIFPRPSKTLRPVVQLAAVDKKHRSHLGRGFTVQELKAVGVHPNLARTIGISVDLRRTNKSQEAQDRNVQRLKEYLSKLVLFPRKAGKPRKGPIADSTQDKITKAVQVKVPLPFKKEVKPVEFRKITEADTEKGSVYKKIIRQRRAIRRIGFLVRKKNAADKGESGKKAKAAAEE